MIDLMKELMTRQTRPRRRAQERFSPREAEPPPVPEPSRAFTVVGRNIIGTVKTLLSGKRGSESHAEQQEIPAAVWALGGELLQMPSVSPEQQAWWRFKMPSVCLIYTSSSV
jgi:hypothetical protein